MDHTQAEVNYQSYKRRHLVSWLKRYGKFDKHVTHDRFLCNHSCPPIDDIDRAVDHLSLHYPKLFGGIRTRPVYDSEVRETYKRERQRRSITG